MSNNQALNQLLKGMFAERPPHRKLVPAWDLGEVLRSLADPPFEPLGQSPLLELSVKVAFLLAAATARRRSELHALTLDRGHIRWEPHGVRLIPRTTFLAKNQSQDFQPPDIFVPELKSLSSVPEDKKWCPVRALKWYIARTKPLRGSESQLFITSTRPHRAASRDTISRWIVQAIQSGTPGSPSDRTGQGVHAHDTRAVTTSWALLRGVPVEEIMQAACWKSPSTFSSCYLRDVLLAEGRAGRVALSATMPSRSNPSSVGHSTQ